MNDNIIVGEIKTFADTIAVGVVLIDFWASWCGPCKMLSPVIDELATDMKDIVKVVKVNIDEQEEIAEKYKIASIPTLVLLKDGVESARAVGYRPKSQIVEFVDKHMNNEEKAIS